MRSKILISILGIVWIGFLLFFATPSKSIRKILVPVKANPIEEPAIIGYVVKRGDFLSKIGDFYGINWRDLATFNDLKPPYALQVGQTINVPKLQAGKVINYIKILDPKMEDDRATELGKHFFNICTKNGIDPKVFVAIAYQENRFRASGISKNDIGMLQLNYQWQFVNTGLYKKYTIEEINTNWKLNAELGVKHLVECQKANKVTDGLPVWTCYNSVDSVNGREYYDRVRPYLERL